MDKMRLYRLAARSSSREISLIRRKFNTSTLLLSDERPDMSWDYLTKSPQENSSEPKDLDLKSLNLKTELDDLYTTPSRQAYDHPRVTKDKVSFVVKPQSTPGVSGSDLEDVFRPRRRMSDTTGVAGVTATQKEREIFSKIFDTILSRSASDGGKSAQNKTGLSSTMQALFEKTILPRKTGDSTTGGEHSALSEDGQNVQLGLTHEDVRKYPLSMASLLMSQRSGKENKSQGLEFQNALKEKLEPIFKHLDSMETDYEVSQYYLEKIVKVYKENTESGTKHGNNFKSKGLEPRINDIEDLKSLSIDPEFPPVSPKVLPLILGAVIRTLMDNFNSPEVALTLFEVSKLQGIDFYVSSCNCDVYNEVLRIKWDAFKDLYTIESLISEMDINGLKGNSDTSEILSSVARYSIDMKQGSVDSAQVPLWSQEDEERLTNLNRYRLRVLEALVQQDNAGQGELLSKLISL